jgi:hypothetical protein
MAEFAEISCPPISGLAGLQATRPPGHQTQDGNHEPGPPRTASPRPPRRAPPRRRRRDGRRRRPEPFAPAARDFPILDRLFFALSASAPNPRVLSLRSSVPLDPDLEFEPRTLNSARLFAPAHASCVNTRVVFSSFLFPFLKMEVPFGAATAPSS